MAHAVAPHGQIDPADYVAAARSGSRAERTFHGARIRLIERAAAVRGRAVLEVGCGTGCLTLPLAATASRTVGVDLSPQHIAALAGYADDAGVEIEGVVASGADLPFDDDSFDVVVLASVVHLVPEPGPLLREAERVCRRDGRLVVATRGAHTGYGIVSDDGQVFRMTWLESTSPGRSLKVVGDFTTPTGKEEAIATGYCSGNTSGLPGGVMDLDYTL